MTRVAFVLVAVGLVAGGAVACASQGETDAGGAGDARDAGTSTSASPVDPAPTSAHDDGDASSPVADAAPPRSAACLALDAKMQAALDANRKGTSCKETALAVKTPACPVMSYVSADDPTTPADHVYRVASNTKTFVASAILELAADGKLDLDDHVTKYLPSLDGVDGMTVRQVLNHTAGLYDYLDSDAFYAARDANPKRAWQPEELVAFAREAGAYFAPGAGYRYSNTGYIVAGMVAEAASGESVGALIRDRLLAPHGFATGDLLYFAGEEPAVGTLGRGFDGSGNETTTKYDPSWLWACGAMAASTSQLARWTELRGSGQLHSAATQKELTKGVATGGDGVTYGLGAFMYDASYGHGAGRSIGHVGIINGYHTYSFYYPDTQVTVTAIVTCEDGSGSDLLASALTAMFAK